MSVVPTSTLTFDDLLLEVAIFLSIAYYGADGTEEAQTPIDTQDLADCKRHVNNAIRMFINDAPLHGWRWARPTASLVLWPSVAVDSTITATGVFTSVTTITATEASFYPSMEGKDIVVTDVGTFEVATYVSSTVITIAGDNAFAGKTFSVEADGNYTLPRTFGGSHTGPITYGANSNTGAHIEWSSESQIRRFREPSTTENGFPFLAAVRVREGTANTWELMTYPIPHEETTVELPFDLHFEKLTAITEVHPAGFQQDEAVKAACIAVAERDSEDSMGQRWNYYRSMALPNAYKVDARSAPRRLGSMNQDSQMSENDYRRYIQRPTVTVTGV